MHSIKTTVSVTLMAGAIATGTLLTTTSAAADGLVDMNIPAVNGEVRLVVKRQQPDGSTRYERVIVQATQADKREAELLQDPTVLSVERDALTYNPIPLRSAPVPQTQSLSSGQKAGQGVRYSDPLFDQQAYFTSGHEYNSRLGEAHHRLKFTDTVRVGIVDGGFVRSPDVTYVEGVSISFGRGTEFYNSDPGVECPYLEPGEEKSIHGHLVAQVVGATPNNGIGIAGASPKVELVAARSMACIGSGFAIDNAESVRWLAGDPSITDLPMISEPVDVINMSLGSQAPCRSYTQDAIDYARAKGITVVVSAGNDFADSAEYAPANCEGVVTVGATKKHGYPADYSNSGENITVAAQGSQMPMLDDNNEVVSMYGTSFASPLVAGIIASALADRPRLTPDAIESILATSGKPIRLYSTSNREWNMGAGILDAMLFLDGAGVAREEVTVQPALSGTRERFAEALMHPSAKQYLKTRLGVDGICDIIEIRGKNSENPTNSDSTAVFSVAPGDRLDPLSGTARLAGISAPAEAMIFTKTELEAEASGGRQLGVAQCDLASGSNCSVKSSIQALDIADMPVPAVCI